MNVAGILELKGRDVATATPTDSIESIARNLAALKIGAIVVVEADGSVCGIVSERDIVRSIASKGAEALAQPASELMTRAVVTCAEDETNAKLMEKMTAGRFRHLPVVASGKLAGIVSIGDVVKARIAEAEAEAEAMRSYITSA
ncbi:MAG: CBS domain-containing protein [Hyphomicrobiaceae bacterium]|nr:CBS domain-containing protein [Hyphomicrobiaceae bacterium]